MEFPSKVRYPALIIPLAPLSSNSFPSSLRFTSLPPEILMMLFGSKNLRTANVLRISSKLNGV